MALRIRTGNLNKKIKIPDRAVRKAALAVLKKFGKKRASVDITFVSDAAIKRLNTKYMGKRRATDVLAFGLQGNPLVGDIYISSDAARENGRAYGTGFRREILLYTVHGALHLMGMADRTKKEKEKIRKAEEKFLRSIGS